MRPFAPAVFVAAATLFAPLAGAIDETHLQRGRDMADRAIAYLRSQQDAATGGWSVPAQGPQMPAVTALVLTGMLHHPAIDERDRAVEAAAAFILSKRQPDGGVYDGILPSYNTSISVSALVMIATSEAAQAVADAQAFLKTLQWSEAAPPGAPTASVVTREHAFYGGVGYGSHGRPDNSNLSMFIQALHDSGLSAEDAAFQRALVFLQRTQMHRAVNDQAYAKNSTQGGFIYATGPERDQPGVGESKAGTIVETLDDGSDVSSLRAYGSMTYAGFKSYIYADLHRDDERVRLAYDWIQRNYTLDENPGIGLDGYYYYLVTFARAMDAWGLPTIDLLDDQGATIETRDWANDLVDTLATLQDGDGSFRSVDERWMENDVNLITAYALIALQLAVR